MKPGRVVIYRLGSLGDTIVALPCLHAIARAFPDAERVLLTHVPVSAMAAPLESILGGSGLVQRFMAYPVGLRSFGALRALRRSLHVLDTDTLVYLTPARGLRAAWRDLLFFRLCGFKHVTGIPLRTDLLTNSIEADGTIEQECHRLARCIETLVPVDLSDSAAWDLHLSEAERKAATIALGATADLPRIAINMGGKVARCDWGEANWRAMVQPLRGMCPDHAMVLIGAAEDAVRAAGVGQAWGGPVANLCGRVSPRVSAAAMAGSRVFIGHESGSLHLAASVGVRCVGLYGDGNPPRKWHPYGHQHRIIHDLRGMSAIRVEQVLEAVRAQLLAHGGLAADMASAP